MKIRHPFFFLAPDNGAPGSSGAAAVAAPVTPPVVDAGGGGDTFDPLTYEPPNADDVTNFIKTEGDDDGKGPLGKGGQKETPPADDDPAKAAADEAARKAADEKQKAEAAAKKGGDEPAKLLRERVKTLEADKATLEAKLAAATTDKQVETLTKQIAEKETAIAEREKKLTEMEQKLLLHSPHVAGKLKELEDNFNREYLQTLEVIPDLAQNYRSLVDEFEALPRGKPEYAEKLREFRNKIKEDYPDDVTAAFDQVRKGYEFRQNYSRTSKEVQENAQKIDFEGKSAAWKKEHDYVETNFEQWFEPPTDAAKTDPYHPLLFLKELEANIDEKERARINQNIKGTIDRVFNGIQPRTKADFPDMDDAAIQAELARLNQAGLAERQQFMRVAAISAKTLAYWRPFVAEFTRMRDRLKALGDGRPPNPAKGKDEASGTKTGEGGDPNAIDPLTYEPPEVRNSDVGA